MRSARSSSKSSSSRFGAEIWMRASAFEPWGITLDEPAAERAHYFGARALDGASDDEDELRHVYFHGYAEGAGVPRDGWQLAEERIRSGWAKPNLDVWRQHVRGSL